jgi:hypothetical protein
MIPPASNYQAVPPPPPLGASGRLVASSDTPLAGGTDPTLARPMNPPSGQLPPVTLVNNRQVTIDYKITRVGPSGVGKVELWMTKDDGRTWEMAGEDPDLTPPMTVELPAEGVYGFLVVVQSKAGKARPRPIGGDLPDIRVELDTTPPSANLYRPEADPSQLNALLLSWDAHDRNLAANPVTLEWAERKDGPWQIIRDGLPGTGRHTWKLPETIPYNVFLRLSARDSAGNVQTVVTPEPLCIDLKEPEARVLGVAGAPRRP